MIAGAILGIYMGGFSPLGIIAGVLIGLAIYEFIKKNMS